MNKKRKEKKMKMKNEKSKSKYAKKKRKKNVWKNVILNYKKQINLSEIRIKNGAKLK